MMQRPVRHEQAKSGAWSHPLRHTVFPCAPAAWLLFLAVFSSGVQAQFEANVATNKTSGVPAAYVVLTWPDAAQQFPGGEAIVSYNLYRKIDPAAPYPKYPINFRPIVPLEESKGTVTVTGFLGNTKEWKVLEAALVTPQAQVQGPGDNINVLAPFFDPRTLGSIEKTSTVYNRLQMLARINWKIAASIGQGYKDTGVTAGRRYYYELRGCNGTGGETVLDTDITILAGSPLSLSPPPELKAEAGDSRVLLTWGEVDPTTVAYTVYRAKAITQNYQPINEASFLPRITHDINGACLMGGREDNTGTCVIDGREEVSVNGYLDIQKWDESNNPVPRTVYKNTIYGPKNGTEYLYKVACVDILGNEGPLSAAGVSATPLDTTAPAVPVEIIVSPQDDTDSIEIRWVQVHRDSAGHPELVYEPGYPAAAPVDGVKYYRVYRYETADNPSEGATQLGGTIAPSTKGELMSIVDTASILRSAYGTKTFWYRVECEDAAGNVSARSAAVSGFLKDKTPPQSLPEIEATSYATHITINWPLSPESAIPGNDIAAYLVYRNICHKGSPAPPPALEIDTLYKSSWVLIGSLTQTEAEAFQGRPFIEDRTIPKGSPLCYAYIVKVQDKAQNRSGHWPPDPTAAGGDPFVCRRLIDATAPDPAVITSLKARDGGIRVAWIGPPQQDIMAYYVYRSDTETGTYTFAGGKTAGKNPQPLASPLTEEQFPTGCEMPLSADKTLSEGWLLDTNVQPKNIYWYRVLGIDTSGNISDIIEAVPVSTFTFSTPSAPAPAITSIVEDEGRCALKLTWTPEFDTAEHAGFAVLKSTSGTGPFRQAGSLVTGSNEYIDDHVRSGATYWYRVVQVNKDGSKTQISTVQSKGVVK